MTRSLGSEAEKNVGVEGLFVKAGGVSVDTGGTVAVAVDTIKVASVGACPVSAVEMGVGIGAVIQLDRNNIREQRAIRCVFM